MKPSPVAPERPEPTSSAPRAASIALRFHWMFVGVVALGTSALALFRADHSVVSLPSVMLWIVAASMIGARWLDISRFNGLTAEGLPASRSHLHRYAVGVGAATAALWGGALALG
jgi:hypothetical protein